MPKSIKNYRSSDYVTPAELIETGQSFYLVTAKLDNLEFGQVIKFGCAMQDAWNKPVIRELTLSYNDYRWDIAEDIQLGETVGPIKLVQRGKAFVFAESKKLPIVEAFIETNKREGDAPSEPESAPF